MLRSVFIFILLASIAAIVVVCISKVIIQNKKEHYVDYNKAGIGSITGCKDSTISFGATIDDLLKSGYFTEEVTNDLATAERINRRVCPDPSDVRKRGVLQQGVDANYSNCVVTIDGHQYELRSKTLPLTVNMKRSHEKQIVVACKDDINFVHMLLTRPLFFMIENSQPYVVVQDYFVYSTYHVSNVLILQDNPADEATIPIRANSYSAELVPETQVKSITHEIYNIRNRSQDQFDIATMPLSMYYIHRVKELGDAVIMQQNMTRRLMGNMGISKMIKAVLNNEIDNPCFTVEFTCYVPSDPQRMTHLRDLIPLLSVSSQLLDTSCTYQGRGVMYIATRNEILRSMPIPTHSFIRETAVANPNWVCIDFLGITKDIVKDESICGHDKNTVSLWLPCDVTVNIVYIVTPSMKVAVATFYNNQVRRRELMYVQSNHCDDMINDLVGAIQRLDGDLHAHTFDAKNIKVSDVRLRYGIINLQEWYTDHQLSL